MSDPLNDIDKLFLDSIEPLQEAPPPGIWQNIEATLDKTNVEKYRRKAVFFKRLSAALLLVLFSSVMYQMLNNSKSEKSFAVGNSTPAIIQNKQAGDSGKLINKIKTAQPADTKNQIPLLTEQQLPARLTGTQNINNITGNIKRTFVLTPVLTPRAENNLNSGSIDIAGSKAPLLNAPATQGDTSLYNKRSVLPAIANTGLLNSTVAENTKLPGQQIGLLADAAVEKNNLSPAVNGTVQTISVPVPKNKKNNPGGFLKNISLTAFFSPQISGYSLRDDDDGFAGPQHDDDDDKDKIREREKHRFSYTAGLAVNFKMAKKWIIQTGVYLSKTSIDVKPTTLYAYNDNTGKVQYRYNSSAGYAYVLPSFNSSPTVGDSCFTGKSVNSLQYLSIPLNLGYIIKFKKWVIQPTVGIGANFLVKSDIETRLTNNTEAENKNITNIEGLRPVYFNVMAAAELQYPLSKKFSFSLSPNARIALTSINKNNVVQSFTNSIGAAIGINYKF